MLLISRLAVLFALILIFGLTQADIKLSLCSQWETDDEAWTTSSDCLVIYNINDFGCYLIDAHKGQSWKVTESMAWCRFYHDGLCKTPSTHADEQQYKPSFEGIKEDYKAFRCIE